MNLSYHKISQLFKTHPSLKLVRAAHAPLVLSFLDWVFIQPNARFMSQDNLVSKPEDMLCQLNEIDGEQSYTVSG